MSPLLRPRASWLVIAVLGLASVGLALLSQHVFDMQPCPWCVLQRLVFVLIAGVALLGLAWRSAFGQRAIGLLVIALGLCGAAAALWQHFVAAASSSCNLTLADRILNGLGLDAALPEVFEARASCADAAVDLLGVPYEFYSLALFGLFTLAAARLAWRPAR